MLVGSRRRPARDGFVGMLRKLGGKTRNLETSSGLETTKERSVEAKSTGTQRNPSKDSSENPNVEVGWQDNALLLQRLKRKVLEPSFPSKLRSTKNAAAGPAQLVVPHTYKLDLAHVHKECQT